MQVCNHPCLSYPPPYHYDAAMLVRRCGKFEVLDRMLVKFHATGHRVLLFSTMTKLLDLLESYLCWRRWGPDQRRMEYLRIDGSTSLEDRCVPISLEDRWHLCSVRADAEFVVFDGRLGVSW